MGGRNSKQNDAAKAASALASQARAAAAAQIAARGVNSNTVSPSVGNWSPYVKNATSSKPEGTFNFYVGKSGGGGTNEKPAYGSSLDPAFGCAKDFSATYTCGLDTNIKNVNIPAVSDGQAAVFDCSQESDECNAYKLTLDDTGNLTLTGLDNGIIWQSNTTKTGVALDMYKAVNGKYKRNYLLAGEFLEQGEFIGSPSGNCYLIMSVKSTYPGNSLSNPNPFGKTQHEGYLELRYELENCHKVDDVYYGKGKDSAAIYNIPKTDPSLIGKVGYYEPDLTLRPYPQTMIKLGSKFFKIGGFSNDGGEIKSLPNSSVSDCQSECLKNDQCNGFVFDESTKTCHLKNSGMFPKSNREPSKTSTLYMRSSIIDGGDSSCPSEVVASSGNVWGNSLIGDNMTSDTKCTLSKKVAKQYKQMVKDNKNLETQANNIVKNLSTLTQKDYNLGNNLDQSLKKMRKDLDDYNQQMMDKQAYEERSEDVHAMSEDTELRMVSNNYTFLLWSILAIIILLGAIRHVRR